jgi:hypothetical protein
MGLERQAAVALLALAPFVAIAAEPMALKGLRGGMTPDQVKTMHPALKCTEPDSEGTSSCRWDTSQLFDRSAELESLAGFPTRNWSLTFHHGTLRKVNVIFFENHDEEIIKALSERYGKPKRLVVPVANRMGGKWNEALYTWARSGDEINMSSSDFPAAMSGLTFTSADYNRDAAKAEKQQAGKRSKDL